MDQGTSDSAKSKIDEDRTERFVEEFERLSGQGDSAGWRFDRGSIHGRADESAGNVSTDKGQNPHPSRKERD